MFEKKPIDDDICPFEIDFDPWLIRAPAEGTGNIDPTVVDRAFFRYVIRLSGG